MVKNPPANAGDLRDVGSIPGSGRSPGRGHDNLLQYSYLENLMDRRAWWATIHKVTKSQTQLRWLCTHTHFCLTFVVLPIWKDSILFLLFPLIPCLISWTSYTLTYLLHIPYTFFYFYSWSFQISSFLLSTQNLSIFIVYLAVHLFHRAFCDSPKPNFPFSIPIVPIGG